MTAARPTVISPSGRVQARPPAPGRTYWRVTVLDPTARRRIRQTTGGRTREEAERTVQRLEAGLSAHAPAGVAAIRGRELLEHYLDPRRPKNHGHQARSAEWSASYADQVSQLVERYLEPVLANTPLTAWTSVQAYEVLDSCPTAYMVDKVRRTLSAVLAVGVADGFLRPDQRDLHRINVPVHPTLRPPKRPRARRQDAAALLHPDEVPSLRQVAALASAAQPGMHPRMWAAAVNSLAYLGVRVGELFALSPDDVLGDYPEGLVTVQYQVIETRGHPKRLSPPKNGFARLAAACDITPIGFPLRDWLTERAAESLKERAAGTNPMGALFASPRGGWWTRSNFRARCFNPAATGAGWRRLTWTGPVRRRVGGRWVVVLAERHDWVHPVHALRHHYAYTARDIWGWTGAELCLSGGWTDEAFVAARYYGSTEESYRRALAKQAAFTTAVATATREAP